MPEMNLFQWVFVTLLTLIAVRDTIVLIRGQARRRTLVPRIVAAGAAAALIAFPNQTSHWATWFGIGRGVDLVIYVYILVSLAALFYLYARCVRLERQVTAIVRWEALHAAECNVAGSQSGTTASQSADATASAPQDTAPNSLKA